MKSRLLVAAVAFLGYAILNATPANADTHYYIDDADAWGTAGNWDTVSCDTSENPGLPENGDSIVICPGKALTMIAAFSADDVEVRMLSVVTDTELRTDQWTLTVGGAAHTGILTIAGTLDVNVGGGEVDIEGNGPHPISGNLKLSTATSTLRASGTYDPRLYGAGTITGGFLGAQIITEAGSDYINDMEIRGILKIDATNGSFTNGYGESDLGRVLAQSGGTLDIVAASNISDVANTGSVHDTPPAYRWGVDTNASAVLKFNQDLLCCDDDPGTADDATELYGDFYVGAGTLRIGTPSSDIDVETTGDLRQIGGIIEAGTDNSIAFNVTCPGSCP